ncbi:phosphopentomutase [Helicovermis profundi]|uniref:Phosphopentomutase n=1 Tax=Helicovermis profundi TaxID=3065157 RepID=A0AAU9EAT3_9FIRM|nr:phosphopentomutase [Clostridia bacterium S502]
MINRVVIFIMDSVGIGALPDSEKFGDIGVNTFGNIIKKFPDINIKNLKKLGLGNIDEFDVIEKEEKPIGSFGRSMEVSNGKDTTTGHWEISGLRIDEPFQTYPNGFPSEVIEEFENKTGRKILCNKPASGTVILEELGEEHMKTGKPIVYTSADSVFQIAAHEEIIPLEELYKMCEIAREILRGKNQVARVIARPFIGKVGAFERTPNRHDYSLDPFGKTVLDIAKEAGYDVQAVGKIVDIFNGHGITESVHTVSNMDGIDKTIEYLNTDSKGIIFSNLVDFDAKYGHRRNVKGYKEAIEALDERIPEILSALKDNDMIIFTADHGNDPTYKGTDHTREHIPLLIYGKNIKAGVNIGTRKTFADIAATISDVLNIDKTPYGESFKSLIVE